MIQTIIHIDNLQKDLPIEEGFFLSSLLSLFKFLRIECTNLSVYFTTIDEICKLHATYFQDPSPTDCISFPINNKEYLGEIFVCPAIAIEYAKDHNLDPTQETLLYVIHGLLHLIGYDDIDAEERKKMREMEQKCLTHLQQGGIKMNVDES